jgi:hypothetical protein
VSWDRLLEQRLAEAAARGELDAPTLKGKPLTDLDRPRSEGWWADQFVRRELSHDRRVEALAAMSTARAAFWRADTEPELLALVAVANRAVTAANVNLVEADRLALFDPDDVVRRWAALRSVEQHRDR